MRIKGADAEGASCKDITCVPLLLFLGTVRTCSAGPWGCLKEPGGRVLGSTALLPRATRHTQRPVVSEKLCPPSCEHWPPGLPPPTPALGQSSRVGRDGYACYTQPGRRGLCHTLSLQLGGHREDSGTGHPGLKPSSACASWGKLLANRTGL